MAPAPDDKPAIPNDADLADMDQGKVMNLLDAHGIDDASDRDDAEAKLRAKRDTAKAEGDDPNPNQANRAGENRATNGVDVPAPIEPTGKAGDATGSEIAQQAPTEEARQKRSTGPQ